MSSKEAERLDSLSIEGELPPSLQDRLILMEIADSLKAFAAPYYEEMSMKLLQSG